MKSLEPLNNCSKALQMPHEEIGLGLLPVRVVYFGTLSCVFWDCTHSSSLCSDLSPVGWKLMELTMLASLSCAVCVSLYHTHPKSS